MTEATVTLRMASNLIGYTFAEVTIPTSPDITPEQVARLHWEYNLRFLQEQERISKEPVTEEQEAAVTKAAVETVKAKLKATEMDQETKTPPWENAPTERAANEPWKSTPKFDLF